MGDLIPIEIVRLICLLKIKNISTGYSGVRIELLERMIDLYNRDIMPVIHELGSLGASGDLAPLAHLGLTVIGEGEVYSEGKLVHADDINLEPFELSAKEGLAIS